LLVAPSTNTVGLLLDVITEFLLNFDAPAIARGDLKPVLESYAPPGSPISVVYPQKRHLLAKVCAFVNFISELMAQLRQQRIVE
jgi:DNA-binding transcriptional LysR family regulator